MSVATAPIRTARRVDRFTYAIRNIVAEARKVEQGGMRVRYLNPAARRMVGMPAPGR